MNEQYFEMFAVSDYADRKAMTNRVNELLKDGWRIVHIAGAGARPGYDPSYAVVFEKQSASPQIQ